MQIDPRRLAVLLAVHRGGGVLAAARALHLTPSAVSQQVARLEAEVGGPVLDRRPGGAVLTAAGRVLAEAAEGVEAELHEAERALAVLSGDLTGTVTLGSFQSVLRAVLLPLVPVLAAEHAGLVVEVRQSEGPEAHPQLRTGELDVLVLEADSPLGRARPRGTRDVAVLDEPWLVLTPEVDPAPTSLQDLRTSTWLGVDPTAAAYDATERVLGAFAQRPPTRHRYDDYTVAISMVAGGLGVALVPALALVGPHPDGVRVTALPGTGTRRLVARHRSTRVGTRREVATVLREVVRAAARATAPVTGGARDSAGPGG